MALSAMRAAKLVRPGMRAFASGAKLDAVGVVGALGVVGTEMKNVLEYRDFPTKALRFFEAPDQAGKKIETKFGTVTTEAFSVESARECEICLMAIGDDMSKEVSPKIAGGPKNTLVIDNSAAWRYDKDVPLLVPEINGDAAGDARIISNPNCTTAVGSMAIYPLHKKFGVKSVLMSTYQAASGAGAPGMNELTSNIHAWAKTGEVPKPEAFAHQLLFNVIPHIDAFQPNGYTKEEMKVTWEMPKIFGCDIKVACTAVRVPTLRAHSEAITIITEKPISPDEAREVLKGAGGVEVVDDPSTLKYPLPLNATGKYDVLVGRIRQSTVFGDHGLEFFVSGDQLLRGAALNAVIIGELEAKKRLG